MNLTQKIIESHLQRGKYALGEEVSISIDQTLTQDATGTLVMLELEAMELERTHAEVSVQYIDHNLLQLDSKNPDDHLFLRSACRKYGIWLSPPGNGVSHPVHQQRFGAPGKTLLGSDSHTPAAGALGMLAIGAGGLEVARAIAGQPYSLQTPKVWGIELVGQLPAWVSAKDIILELLRRHDVDGGVGYVIEYYGPGLAGLSAMDRHVIANMGAELGATSSIFPSDNQTRHFLTLQNRGEDWIPMQADPNSEYDRVETIDLAELEPLAAMPSSPGKVVSVRTVAGKKIYQSYIGSSANPGFRDFAVAARIASRLGKEPEVSLDINPSSSQVLSDLTKSGDLGRFIESGARIHQAGCNGCIGMGQAPASDRASLRTVPRNFPGRSGTADDQVYLVSPETAAASATRGEIIDPTNLEIPCPRVEEPREPTVDWSRLEEPLDHEQARHVELRTGPNIVPLPDFEELPDTIEATVLLELGDNISTDEILPAGARILPFRSNIPKISTFCFEAIDGDYAKKAQETQNEGGHVILAGKNYGQGSSREHAALAPRYLGLRFVIAKSFARIHRSNLINFGILPLTPINEKTMDLLKPGTRLAIRDLRDQIEKNDLISVERCEDGRPAFDCLQDLSERERRIILAGGLINQTRQEMQAVAS